MNELTTVRAASNVEAYRASTEAADLCREIVIAASSSIQGRNYVSVEGWQAIARAHGCAAGARDVERVEGGVRAIGEVRDILTGALIATAEGFVGEDEPTWYGGKIRGRDMPKRADYAIRAMAQTRAMSRACRSAFAHVVVMMKAGLSTTPLEEVPLEGFDRDTGEIIDTVVAEKPAKRHPPLAGPYTSKTALWAAVKAFVHSCNGMSTNDELLPFLETQDVKDLLEQCERDAPGLWSEGLPELPEYEPLESFIHRKKREFEEVESIANSPAAKMVRAG